MLAMFDLQLFQRGGPDDVGGDEGPRVDDRRAPSAPGRGRAGAAMPTYFSTALIGDRPAITDELMELVEPCQLAGAVPPIYLPDRMPMPSGE